MESKRHEDLDGELDIQALLDKYLPDDEDETDGGELTETEAPSDDRAVTEDEVFAPDDGDDLYMEGSEKSDEAQSDDFVRRLRRL